MQPPNGRKGEGTPKGERGHLVRGEKTFLSSFARKVKDLKFEREGENVSFTKIEFLSLFRQFCFKFKTRDLQFCFWLLAL